MKFEDLKRGTILWAETEAIKDKLFIVVFKEKDSVTLAIYEPQIKQIRRITVDKEGWMFKSYYTLSNKQVFSVDSEHAHNIIKEYLEYTELLYRF